MLALMDPDCSSHVDSVALGEHLDLPGTANRAIIGA
jgi:hypothetical protein